MPTIRVLFLTAVVTEARVLARAFHLAPSPAALPLWRGNNLTLACIGIRGSRLSLLEPIVAREPPQLVVMAGVAGALSPALHRGDVVVDSLGPVPLPPLPKAIPGRIHTCSHIAATPTEKSSLFQKTGCLAVDMETAIARPFAARLGAAFVAIRGISDSADEPLDPQFLTLVDADGNPRISRAVAMLCLRPWKLAELLRLQKATTQAMTAVAQTAEALLASPWPLEAAVRPPKT